MLQYIKWGLVCLTSLLILSCSAPAVRDGAPTRDVDISLIPDAVPRVEPITRAGNKSPYVIFGKQYEVMPSSKGYTKRGVASWYGTKFHGRKTSNGETYDMFAMTAAHKTLPIPSYVKVTNLRNGKKVIVRVNDRGPFHGDRVIDLSFVAAKKLGYADVGTAEVEVVAIDPAQFQRNTVEAPQVAYKAPPQTVEVLPANTFLQTGAFASRYAAEQSGEKISKKTGHSVTVREGNSGGRALFKVLVGPITDRNTLTDLRTMLIRTENLAPFVVYD